MKTRRIARPAGPVGLQAEILFYSRAKHRDCTDGACYVSW